MDELPLALVIIAVIGAILALVLTGHPDAAFFFCVFIGLFVFG